MDDNYSAEITETIPPSKKKKTKKLLVVIILALGALAITGGVIWGIHWYNNRGFRAEPGVVTFESDGGQAAIEIIGPSNWRLLSTPKSWCSVVWQGNTLVCTVSENDYYERGDTISIGNDHKSCRIIIKQESGAFYCTSPNQSVSPGGGSASFYICGQTNWTIAEGPENWGSAYRNGSTLTWNVSENHGGPRSDYVVLKAGAKVLRLSVTQPGALKAERYDVSASSGSSTKRIRISGPDNWDCRSSEWWMDVDKEGDCVKIEIDANDDTVKREGTIIVTGGGQKIEINVTQSGKSSGGYYYPWYF